MFLGSTLYFCAFSLALSGWPLTSAVHCENWQCANAGITCPSAKRPSPTAAHPSFFLGVSSPGAARKTAAARSDVPVATRKSRREVVGGGMAGMYVRPGERRNYSFFAGSPTLIAPLLITRII